MPYEDDEAKREARARLQARMERRARAEEASQEHTPSSRESTGRSASPQAERRRASASRTSRERVASSQGRASSARPSQGRTSASRASSSRVEQQGSRRTIPSASGDGASALKGLGASIREAVTSVPSRLRRLSDSPPPRPIAALLDRLPFSVSPLVLYAVAIIIVLVIIFALIVPRCSGSQASDTSSQSATQTAASTSASSSASQSSSSSSSSTGGDNQSNSSATDEQRKALASIIGEDEADKLLETARTNTAALWIAAHPDKYAFDGVEVQKKILKLAADEPDAITYVREFPSQYPNPTPSSDGSLAMSTQSPSSNVPDTSIPHLYQWDLRWGNTVYSSTAFGLTGCGPTSFAMVYQGLTGKTDKTPYDFGKIAQERDYMAEYDGTQNEFFTDVAGEFGLTCETYYATYDTITQLLSNGTPVIVNVGPGQFTDQGHFFVLTGLDDDGNVIVNDPYSVVRSSRTWSVDDIANDALMLFAYSVAT